MTLPKPMLNKNQTITPFKPEKKYNVLLSTWLSLVIVASVALVAITLVIKKYYEPEFLTPLTQQKDIKILPEEVHSYTGTITEIKKDYLIIKALADKNYLLKDQLMMVKIDEATEITGLLIPKTIGSQSETAAIKSTKIDKTELKIGQNVTVSSQENIKNKISFTPDKIETQIVK